MDQTHTLEVLLERSDNSGSTAFFEVPEQVMAGLGTRKRLPLTVTVNGATYRTTTSVYDGRVYVPMRAEIRAAAGVEPGQRFRVALSRDDEPRTIATPPDLVAALEAAGLRDSFERFSYSHRKEYVQAIEDAKRPETRASRIEKTLAAVATKFGVTPKVAARAAPRAGASPRKTKALKEKATAPKAKKAEPSRRRP